MTCADGRYMRDRFMIYEIVRNAIHATVEHHGEEKAKASPVTLTFVHGAKDLVVRVTDQGKLKNRFRCE